MIFRLLSSIISGALAGWIAGKMMDSEGGLLRNIIIGIVGGLLGSFVAGLIGISAHNFIGGFIISVLGACLFIFIGKKLFS